MNKKSRLKNTIPILFFICVVVLLLSQGVFAQVKLATFEGTVAEPDGNPLPGASVVLRNMEAGYTYSSLSRMDGRFIISGVEPGLYEVKVTLSGFTIQIRQGMTFTVGAKVTLNFQLTPSSLEEEVTVVAESPLVEVTKSDVSDVVSRQEIDDLPLLDRNFSQLTALQAGVSDGATGLRDMPGRANGQPQGTSEVLVDGVSNEAVWWASNRSRLPADAIQEFRVLVNQFGAEYGNASGLVMHAITRSGTNDFKGRISAFYRDEALDAKNYFADKKEPFSLWRFGGFLGGPIKKDKAHFFVIYEGTRQTEYSVITSPMVPRETVPREWNNDQFLAKLNYQLNEKNMFSFRFTRDNPRETNQAIGGFNTKSVGFDEKSPDNILQANWTLFPSDTTMNEFRFQYSHRSNDRIPLEPPDFTEYVLHYPSGLFGNAGGHPTEHPETRFQFLDNFNLYFEKHSIKFGFDLNFIKSVMTHHYGTPGHVFFTSDLPFDANNPATYPLYMWYNQVNPVIEGMKTQSYAFFVHDTWRIHPRLTLNVGLRYSYYTWDQFIYKLKYKVDNSKNFDPRIAFTWDPVGDNKTVIRGGIGKYTNNPMGNTIGASVVANEGYQMALLYFPGWPDPFQPNPFLPTIPLSFNDEYGFADNLRLAYSLQYTLGIQRELVQDFSVSADLVYVPSYHHSWFVNLNPVIPGTSALHVDPTRGDVWNVASGGHSNYKGLYLNVKKRYSNGWAMEIAYTLSKALSDVEYEYNYPSNYEDRSLDYGPTNADARHRLAASGIVDLPLGFRFSAIFRYRSALPYNIVLGFDANKDGRNSDYPPGSKRNSGRGTANYTLDARINKQLTFASAMNVQIFAEMFNVTNRVNFGSPTGNMRSSLFGEPFWAGAPRLIQFGLRFNF